MTPAYEEPEEGEWVQPITKGYKIACCDCGLVHNMDFRTHKGKIQFRVFRNNRSTAMMRRHHHITVASARPDDDLAPPLGGTPFGA